MTDRDMDGIHSHFTVRTYFSFLLLILLQTSAEAQTPICEVPSRTVEFAENNKVGDTVTTITLQPGVVMEFKPPPANPKNPFGLEGNRLIATSVLDYETEQSRAAEIICTEEATSQTLELIIVVAVVNVNDNEPTFEKNLYEVSVNEMSPVGTTVDRFDAKDADGPLLYYTLTPESNAFKLNSATIPDLLVKTPLEYDKVKNVQLILYAQDTPLASSIKPSFTATTTIMVTILDVDDRPPWFQPCITHEIGGAVVCQSSGYTGWVVLNEQEPGALPLKPGPIYAIDGDSGINEEITYSFLGGNSGGLFDINPTTGNISMLKPADVLGSISLTVLAAQKISSYQIATTTVTVSVQEKSLHPPKFQMSQYEAIVRTVGTMAVDSNNEPLRILATDDDYTATGGLNPHMTYVIEGSNDFSLVEGYLFMIKDLPEETLSLQVVAQDSSNNEATRAQLTVTVTSGLTTTSLPLSTDSMTTTSIGESTSLTTEGSVSTAGTAHPYTGNIGSGDYGPGDMAAIGVTLSVLLLICVVVIAVLAVRVKKDKADWKKINETAMFQNSLSQGGQKEGLQYKNDAFQNDEDGSSIGFGGSEGRSAMAGGEPRKAAMDFSLYSKTLPSVSPTLQRDDTSQAGSDKSDNDKEVKPILTKEKRMDEGYKSVWFKEDIDPNAKEEVVIIPDSREDDSDEDNEEQSSSDREDEDDSPQIKTQKVFFSEADMDSGLGVKMDDPAEDSEDDEVVSIDL